MDQLHLLKNTKWRYLLLLDACRYDFFEEEYKHYLEGELVKAWSPACRTNDWLSRAFPGKQPNIVYFSGTPLLAMLKHLGVEKWGVLLEPWREEYDYNLYTCHPSVLNRAVLKEKDRIPAEKQVIVHYVQPHYPYIGTVNLGFSVPGNCGTLEQIYRTIKERNLFDRWREAYRANLRLVLEYVSELVEHLEETIVVTSDHGEMLGEDNMYFHNYPPSITHPKLRTVPWLVIKKD